MRDYSIHRQPGLSSYTKSNAKIILFGVILVLSIAVLFTNLPKKKSETIPNNATSNKTKEIIPVNFKITSSKELLERIEKISQNAGGTYSIYIYDLNKKQGFGINENIVMTAASVNKIAILAALYHLAGIGEVDLEKIIVLQKEDIRDYGTGSIRYDPTGTPYSLKTLARLMMEKSDNTAAHILGSLTLGVDKIQNLVDSWRLTQTNIIDNKTSVKDMEILLTKIYQGEITIKPLTVEMLGFMDKSDFDDRIPAGIPPNIKVYHKTGDEIGKIHDVGIVDLPDKPYYIGIMSMDTTDDETTKKTLAQISKLVFEYMKN